LIGRHLDAKRYVVATIRVGANYPYGGGSVEALELTDEADSAPELTHDQKRIFSWLDGSNLVWFK
jgi:hypothetical protein